MGYEMQLKEKNTELARLNTETRREYDELERKYVKKGEQVPQEEADKVEAKADAIIKLRQEITRLEALKEADDYVTKPAGEAQAGGKKGITQTPQSWGQIVIASDQFKSNNKREMAPVNVKALYDSADAAGGYLVRPQRETEIVDIARQFERTLLDILNVSQTTQSAVEYMQMITRTNNAAVVSERTATDGSAGDDVFGLKPQSNIVFDLKTAPVKTIATWIPASRQILADAPNLRNMVDNELTYMLENVLEDEVLNGDGTGNHFTGVLATSGIQTRTQGAGARSEATDTMADTLRRALTDLRLEGYASDGIALSSADAEAVELEKDVENRYMNVYDPVTMRIWRVPVVEVFALDAGTAVAGNWRIGATLWDRMETEIRVGEPDDYFLRNAVAILAELRAAFAVKRPKAFVQVTFSEG